MSYSVCSQFTKLLADLVADSLAGLDHSQTSRCISTSAYCSRVCAAALLCSDNCEHGAEWQPNPMRVIYRPGEAQHSTLPIVIPSSCLLFFFNASLLISDWRAHSPWLRMESPQSLHFHGESIFRHPDSFMIAAHH